ncbi:dipeptidase [Neobacillus sp. PS3-34]|uniref:dipeptidase n=1 Tax=Neobacillus sp. PS3-34 TaxID=3070678 RepID=UPI0027E1BE0C|nr:dipeptidase [Neobacillus sp. PS3-34]WML49221.1 dipeptidase [Neobacillus sp. PS3-34]
MKIFDAHCDVLYKLFKDNRINFKQSKQLHVNLLEMKEAGIAVQCFAIFVSPSVHPDVAFHAALYMADLFFENILKPNPELKFITRKEQLGLLKENEIGAILTLEGCDAIGRDAIKLKTLLRLGIASVGLTWNDANYVADGAMEERGGGLTRFGREVVRLLNENSVWCDVSHLSERGFWDVIELADHPFASHSNCYSLCPHPRNLKNDQILALMERESVMGITFVPHFLTGRDEAVLADIIRHLDHVCSLGGENHVGFGSDFDGTENTVIGLSSIKGYNTLINELLKYYSDIQVRNFLYKNMERRFPGRRGL